MITIEKILSGLFVLFLVFQFNIPDPLKSFLQTKVGKISIIVCVLAIFCYKNPILSILAIIVGYELLYNLITPSSDFPTETEKWSQFDAKHQFEYTLEEQMVAKMTNFKNENDFTSALYGFKPLLENTHDAALISSI
jgi:hypothetical protein